ncbi:MAG: hypothetical protein V1809_08265 [Planctomycetota bacterium]
MKTPIRFVAATLLLALLVILLIYWNINDYDAKYLLNWPAFCLTTLGTYLTVCMAFSWKDQQDTMKALFLTTPSPSHLKIGQDVFLLVAFSTSTLGCIGSVFTFILMMISFVRSGGNPNIAIDAMTTTMVSLGYGLVLALFAVATHVYCKQRANEPPAAPSDNAPSYKILLIPLVGMLGTILTLLLFFVLLFSIAQMEQAKPGLQQNHTNRFQRTPSSPR